MQAAAGYFRAAISSGAWIGPSHACHGIVTCGRGLTVCQPVDQPVGLRYMQSHSYNSSYSNQKRVQFWVMGCGSVLTGSTMIVTVDVRIEVCCDWRRKKLKCCFAE